MLKNWFRQRFLAGTFLRDAFLLIFLPSRLIESMKLGDQADFNRAIDFVWSSIKYSILIALFASASSAISLNETVWYLVLLVNFLLVGFLFCAVLPLLGEQLVTWSDILHVFAYPAGVIIAGITISLAALVSVPGVWGPSGDVFEAGRAFALGSLLALAPSHLAVFVTVSLIVLSCVLFFARALRIKRDVPIWKSLLAVAAVLPVAAAVTAAIVGFERALLSG